MKASRALVITGMHRSGTSAVASVLQRAGVRIGSRLIEGDAGNPRGYFEDQDFVRFHDQQLARSGQRVLAQVGAELEPPRRQDVRQAEELIRRRQDLDLWGFKDPRTSLYLDFWARQLPEARFLLVFRDPVEVVLSLLRRGSGHELEVMADPLAGLRSWRFHNQAILDFHERHADRCLLVDIDQVFADAGGFLAAAAAQLDLPLKTESAGNVLHRDELHRRPGSKTAEAILGRLDPEVVELSRRLTAAADWAAGSSPPPACPPALDEALRRLREMYDEVADNEETVARPVFTLLLALLDGEAAKGASPSAQVFDLLDRIARLHQHAKNLQAKIDRGADRIRRLEEHSGNLEVRVPELEKHNQGLTDRFAELSGHTANLERRARELESHAGNLESQRQRDELRITELSRHCEGLEKLDAERRERLEELRAHTENLESALAAARERVGELEVNAENLEAARQAAVTELGAHADNLERLRSQDAERLRGLEEHAANLESLRRRDEDRLAALGDHVDNLEQARGRDRQRLSDLQTQVGNLERDLARRQAELADLEGERVRLGQEVDSRDHRLSDLETRQAELLGLLARREAAVAGLEGEARRLGGELEDALNDLRRSATSSWTKFFRRLHLVR